MALHLGTLLSLALVLLASCTNKPAGGNAPPTCTILSPTEGAVLAPDVDVPLAAEVTDPEGTYVSVYWTSTVGGAIASGADTTAVLQAGSQILTVQGLDEDGESCEANVRVRVNAAPTLTLVSPLEGDYLASNTSVAFSAYVFDDGAVTDATVTWLNGETVLGSDNPSSDGLSTVIAQMGEGVQTLTIEATDAEGAVASATINVIGDTPPLAPEVSISPDSPLTGDDLVASIITEATDADGQPIAYRYTWYVDGVVSDASETDTLPESATRKGETWTVLVTPNDGYMDGLGGQAAVLIGNSAPSISSISFDPDPVADGNSVTAVPLATDPDGDTLTYSFVWYVSGRPYLAIEDVLWHLYFEREDAITVVAYANDGDLTSSAASANTVVVNALPNEPEISLATAPIESIDSLVCAITDESSDPDDDAVTYTMVWEVDGVAFGSTSSTTWPGDSVGAEHLVAGQVWSCTATPNDGYGDGTAATVTTTVRACAGGDTSCPVEHCQAALDGGGSGGDGVYYLDLEGITETVWCDMTTDGGGWTLVWRSSDDGVDSFTYESRLDLSDVGTADGGLDYRGAPYALLGFDEILAVHAPSNIWASYAVGSADGLALWIESVAPSSAPAGYPMVAGTLSVLGTLCDTQLYVNVVDPAFDGDSYGPTWSVDAGLGCFGLPGANGSVGPNYDQQAVESGARGFGEGLGANTGTSGAGENLIGIYVR